MGVSPFTVHVFCVCPAYFYPRASLMCVLLVSVSLYRLCIGLFLCRCGLCFSVWVCCVCMCLCCVAGVLVSSWGVFVSWCLWGCVLLGCLCVLSVFGIYVLGSSVCVYCLYWLLSVGVCFLGCVCVLVSMGFTSVFVLPVCGWFVWARVSWLVVFCMLVSLCGVVFCVLFCGCALVSCWVFVVGFGVWAWWCFCFWVLAWFCFLVGCWCFVFGLVFLVGC